MLKRIKWLCDQAGISLSALEKELGFGNGSIAKTDEKTQCGRVYAIAKRFDVTVEWLITGESAEHVTSEELRLLSLIRQLNADGVSWIFEQASMLSGNPKYQKGIEKSSASEAV